MSERLRLGVQTAELAASVGGRALWQNEVTQLRLSLDLAHRNAASRVLMEEKAAAEALMSLSRAASDTTSSLLVISKSAARYEAVSLNALRATHVAAPPLDQIWPAAACVDGRVYVAGGHVGHVAQPMTAQVTCFTPPESSGGSGGWTLVAPMPAARRWAQAAGLAGALYVAGGDDGTPNGNARVERYAPASNTWERVADMVQGRHAHQLVSLGGFLYALGGSFSLTSLSACERYDPAENAWTPIRSMSSARGDFAAAAMDGCLYVTGGHVSNAAAGAHGVHRGCERYDVSMDRWTRIADLPEPRWGHALACLNGALYVVGGSAGVGQPPASTCWRYDASSNTWVRVFGSAAFVANSFCAF